MWATTDQLVTMAAGAGSNINLLAPFEVAGASTLGMTIMRTHCTLSLATAVVLADRLRVGFVIDRVAAVGAGPPAGAITAADPEADWMLWRHEQASPTFSPGGANILEYDLRSKRKVQEMSQTMLLCLFNSNGGSKTVNVAVRTLCALP